jgi:hypothetical protein
MPLEATVLVYALSIQTDSVSLLARKLTRLSFCSIDNSSHALNGDYTPTRILAQADAVNVIFTAKTNSNPESEVGLMTSAGKA